MFFYAMGIGTLVRWHWPQLRCWYDSVLVSRLVSAGPEDLVSRRSCHTAVVPSLSSFRPDVVIDKGADKGICMNSSAYAWQETLIPT